MPQLIFELNEGEVAEEEDLALSAGRYLREGGRDSHVCGHCAVDVFSSGSRKEGSDFFDLKRGNNPTQFRVRKVMDSKAFFTLRYPTNQEESSKNI